jgi:hypothetical protein
MVLFAALAPPPAQAVERASPLQRSFLSRVFEIDRLYKSMEGPSQRRQIFLSQAGSPARKQGELLWLTGYRTEIVDESGTALPPDFMCHANLDIGNLASHRKAFGWGRVGQPRLFSLSQGQMEVKFPDGFGIPVLSNEPLHLGSQVLNHNVKEGRFRVRHKATLDFVRDRDLDRPMKSLYQQGVQAMVLLDGPDGYFNLRSGKPEEHGEACGVGTDAGLANKVHDRFGRKFSGHWVVKPGREVRHTPVSGFMRVPEDSTVHYIAIHLHPFAASLELRDVTTGQTVFRSEAEPPADKIGLARVQHYSSPQGLKIYADHAYELISVYENTSDVDQDSMAVMFLYHHDKRFRKPVSDARDSLAVR